MPNANSAPELTSETSFSSLSPPADNVTQSKKKGKLNIESAGNHNDCVTCKIMIEQPPRPPIT